MNLVFTKRLNTKYYFLIIFSLAVLFSFWKLGENDVKEWDEAQYGVNAFEMMHNGDYVNYYYAHHQDTWNAKPPLLVWLIILSYKLFGYNAFALRFISGLASVVFFVFMFKIISLYRDGFVAMISCLILLSCKAIVGFHVGRNGDTDALLVCFLTASVYFFLAYMDFGKSNSIFISAVFLGLAFYTKGTAAFVLIPGLIIYILFNGKLKKIALDYKVWLSVAIFILIVTSWLVIALTKGNAFNQNNSFYKSRNVLETLFYHDTFMRLTDSSFGDGSPVDRSFFFVILDTRFNVWNYFFYLTLLIGIVLFIRDHKKVILKMKNPESRLFVLSISMILPLALILTFAATKLSWYIAPIAPFIAIIIGLGVTWISERFNWFYLVWIPVLFFTFSRHFIELNDPHHEVSDFFARNKNVLEESPAVVVVNTPTQDVFLQLSWHAKRIVMLPNNEENSNEKNQVIFYNSETLRQENPAQLKLIDCYKNNCISIIN